MMNYSFMPSLEYTALIKIASILWNQDDIRDLIANFVCSSPSGLEIPIKSRDKVTEKISLLSLPELLEKKLIDLVNPIGREIWKWRLYHKYYFLEEFVDASLDKLCWTQRGTVDRKRTAEVLVKDKNTDIVIRYKLACIYCLQNDIPLLWDEMPKHLRKTFYRKKYLDQGDWESYEVIWAYELKGKLNKLTRRMGRYSDLPVSPYQNGFDMSMFTVNRVAAEHFFQRLTPEEKLESFTLFVTDVVGVNTTFSFLDDYFPREYFADLLCFLLSQMTAEQHTQVFTNYSFKILLLFLDWPLQNLFIRLANSVWTFLSAEDYHHLISAVVVRVEMDGPKDFDYQKLFREFWLQSPNSYKQHIINRPMRTCELLFGLFGAADKNNISLILKEANIQEKKEIVDCGIMTIYDICENVDPKNEWSLLDFFIEECIPSKSACNKLKKTVKKRAFDCLKKTPKRNGDESIRRSKRLCNKNLAN